MNTSAADSKAWSIDEEIRLLEAFRDEYTLAQMAAAHGRTRNAIVSRLERLGHLAGKPGRWLRWKSTGWVVFATWNDLQPNR